MENNNFFGWFIGLVAAVVIAFLVNVFISSKVPAGYEAILVNSYGQQWVQDMPLVTGRVYYNPFSQDLVTYPIFVQTKDYDEFTVNAKDGSVFKVDPTISYKIEAGATPAIYQKYRKEIDQITDIVMLQMVKDSFRMVINQYTTDEIISKRGEIEAAIEKTIKETSIKDNISIERLTSGLKYPESIEASIASKNQAVQEAQKVENQLRVAEANAKIVTTNAEAAGKARIMLMLRLSRFRQKRFRLKVVLIISSSNGSKKSDQNGMEYFHKLLYLKDEWQWCSSLNNLLLIFFLCIRLK